MEEDKKEEVIEGQEIEENNDGIKISNDVVAVIAGVAVSEVPGVASMAGGFAGGISEVLSGKKNLSKGIKVDVDENKVKIDVNIIVEYGARIPDVHALPEEAHIPFISNIKTKDSESTPSIQKLTFEHNLSFLSPFKITPSIPFSISFINSVINFAIVDNISGSVIAFFMLI